jgi:hypothetical protein
MEMLLAFIYNTLCKVEEKNNASKPKRWGAGGGGSSSSSGSDHLTMSLLTTESFSWAF